jgi:hypothetical protein
LRYRSIRGPFWLVKRLSVSQSGSGKQQENRTSLITA